MQSSSIRIYDQTPTLLLVRTHVPLRWDVNLLGRNALVLCLFLTDEPLRLERRHTSRSGGCDCLSVLLVLDITSGEDALDAGLGGSRYSEDVSIFIELQLGLDELRGGFVADSVEQSVDLEIARLLRLDIFDSEALEQIAISLAFSRHGLGLA